MNITLQNEEEVIALVQRVANQISDPCGLALGVAIGLADMGLVRNIKAQREGNGWNVSLQMRLTSPGCFYFVYFEREIRGRLKAFSELARVSIEWDNVLDWTPEDMSEGARSKLKAYRERHLEWAASTRMHKASERAEHLGGSVAAFQTDHP